jgi:hypothetical protein
MSIQPQSYLAWSTALVSRLLTCIITVGAHLNRNKWKEVCDNFFSSNFNHRELYLSSPEVYVRRVREKFKEEYRRICMTMGWREFGGRTGNLSAKETPELGECETLMRQICEEMTAHEQEKEKSKVLQERMSVIEKETLTKKRKILSPSNSQDSNTVEVIINLIYFISCNYI